MFAIIATMSHPSAVLFDFDGVIADTTNIHIAAWERTFERMGWEVSTEICERAAEIDDRALLRGLFESRDARNGDIEGWVRHKQGLTRTLLAESPRLYPGVIELIRALKGRARLAVVSGTWRENVEIVLDAAGLASDFELVIGKEDVTAVKPAPDAYKLALKRLKWKAADGVALEDSPTGIAAARAAKLRVVAVGHRRAEGEWHVPAPFLPGFKDTAATLAALGFS